MPTTISYDVPNYHGTCVLSLGDYSTAALFNKYTGSETRHLRLGVLCARSPVLHSNRARLVQKKQNHLAQDERGHMYLV